MATPNLLGDTSRMMVASVFLRESELMKGIFDDSLLQATGGHEKAHRIQKPSNHYGIGHAPAPMRKLERLVFLVSFENGRRVTIFLSHPKEWGCLVLEMPDSAMLWTGCFTV